jgi:hypothetical protein
VAADAQEVSRSMKELDQLVHHALVKALRMYVVTMYVFGRSQRHTRARGYAHLLNRTAFPLYLFP